MAPSEEATPQSLGSVRIGALDSFGRFGKEVYREAYIGVGREV